MPEYQIIAQEVIPEAIEKVREEFLKKRIYSKYFEEKTCDDLLKDVVRICMYGMKKLTAHMDHSHKRDRLIVGERATLLLIISLALSDACGINMELSENYTAESYKEGDYMNILANISNIALHENGPCVQENIEQKIRVLIDYVLYALTKSALRDKYSLEQAVWFIEFYI